jgi:hypothetical protein
MDRPCLAEPVVRRKEAMPLAEPRCGTQLGLMSSTTCSCEAVGTTAVEYVRRGTRVLDNCGNQFDAAKISAIVAQLLAAMDMNWSFP